jgi:hypothetical protein
MPSPDEAAGFFRQTHPFTGLPQATQILPSSEE